MNRKELQLPNPAVLDDEWIEYMKDVEQQDYDEICFSIECDDSFQDFYCEPEVDFYTILMNEEG